jgi:hypothetical protein
VDQLVEEVTGLNLSTRELPTDIQRKCMKERRLITLDNLMTFFIKSRAQGIDINKAVEGDWFTIGVLGIKTFPKTAVSGNKYFVWRIYDLKHTSVAVTVYNNAYEKHFNMQEGSVVVILNPVFWMMQKDSFSFKITEAEQVTTIGMSRDYGLCQSISKQQLPCKNIINKSEGNHCSYHIKDKVQKQNRRMVLNDNYGLSHIAMIKPTELHHNLSRGQTLSGRFFNSPNKDSSNSSELKIVRPIGRGVGAMYFKQQQGLAFTETAESLLLKHRKRISTDSSDLPKKIPNYYHPNSHELYQKEIIDPKSEESDDELFIVEDEDKLAEITTKIDPPVIEPNSNDQIEIQRNFIQQLDVSIKDQLLQQCFQMYPDIFRKLCSSLPNPLTLPQ